MLETAAIALPPPYTLVRSAERDVLAEAVRRAPEEGAGTLVLHEGPGLLAFAVVLEPEQTLETAQMAFLLGMTALMVPSQVQVRMARASSGMGFPRLERDTILGDITLQATDG